ncbi:endonuclease/exonuclease/phosphatase family metal-dependent hydrolase [Algoriphagus ratkowskyi]|uniref:Endonuclease/exonuclease/phosphatase family metal-dependent hydrolase n=1 Tax=Algoriphagus ratkowskyi TaxID=57028 RepID=A0A2W7RHB8_9BACT|nr:endonuclease/exonuclease/phosphatase family protein [Algoriphagus ratkowskyi]PZX57760.1 endonuclease/exonuclease/phosphatase family metal-dependent hydrolase [Algoriphagus ratkowskyi]TXD79026.1 endonuclease/exonuclease/phosphatase family protein [Algoriphagus ratkowskyi]
MKIIIWLIFALTLVLFASVYISPEYFRYVGLLPFFIPVILLVNLFLLVILILSWRKIAFLPLLALLIGYKFFIATFQIHPKHEASEGLKVLSYNAHMFFDNPKSETTPESNVLSWLQDQPADVKVFQEFYQDNTTPSRDALKILGKNSNYKVSYHITDGNSKKRSNGLAIFSKYPIINDGKVFDAQGTNGAIFADILVKNDTIRIYNAHLESMRIDSDALENLEGVKENYRQTLGKLQRGSLARSKQLKVLLEHMKNSPHALILLGDLNEIPYSYTYFKLGEDYENAFENAGRGFGFTYNRILFFLRIDHIFSSKKLKAIEFKTHTEVDYSDHYPISATFAWDSFGQ